MRRLRALGRFLVDFVVGDDWRVAAGVVAGLGLTALVAHAGSADAAWAVMPAVVVVVLALSVRPGR